MLGSRGSNLPAGWGSAAAVRAAIVFLGLALAAGCSSQHYRQSADREVYAILGAKSPAVTGMPEGFTIDRAEEDILGTGGAPELPADAPQERTDAGETEPTPEQEATQEPVVLSLEKALEIASLNSRQYQSEKESLYLQALSLTLQRYRFDPQFFGTLSGRYENTDTGGEKELSGDTGFGFGWLLSTGARLSVSLRSSFSQFLTGSPRKAASSLFNVNITQPLLQGAGIAVTEPLTQAERDVIYEMRGFVRFRRTFFVSILSDYYRVLESQQVLENWRFNYESLRDSRMREEMMSEAGKVAEFEVDQVRQQELRGEDQMENARQTYQASLDRFKTTLGLPTETRLALDPRESARLIEEGTTDIDLDPDRAAEIALAHRVDLTTARDSVEDAERSVRLAKNDLLPGLDLSASLDTDTEGDATPLKFREERTDVSVGFELDLPLDKLSERNQYRSRLIEWDRRRRAHTELRDRIVREVRDAWRQFSRAKRSYEIQKAGVDLAMRRVEGTQVLQTQGKAQTRDVLDSRQDLVEAQNALAEALVDYKLARLALARDMGILIVDERGQLKENFEAYE